MIVVVDRISEVEVHGSGLVALLGQIEVVVDDVCVVVDDDAVAADAVEAHIARTEVRMLQSRQAGSSVTVPRNQIRVEVERRRRETQGVVVVEQSG